MAHTLQYDIKEHIEGLLGLTLYPGNFATDISTDNATYPENFGTYKTVPNMLYLMPYVKTDNMVIRLHSQRYDTLSNNLVVVLEDLNRLNQAENTALFGKAYVDGAPGRFKIHEIAARATTLEHKEFIEGTEYFIGVLDIMVQYVEL